jgi:LPS-assembly protein
LPLVFEAPELVLILMSRKALLLSAAFGLALAGPAAAQIQPDLQDRPTELPPPATIPPPSDSDEMQLSSDTLEYDEKADVVTATGNVILTRSTERLRADKVVWNRKTGKVVAEGSIVVVNPQGDKAYGDRIELTDSLKDGVVQNMLVVLNEGGRIAAGSGVRAADGTITVYDAAYTPCAVLSSSGCPKQPSWKITARKVVYNPANERLYYTAARVSVFGFATIPLPRFSHPAGGQSASGLLLPDLRYSGVNGASFSLPYYFSFGPNRDLTIKPQIFSRIAPLIEADYRDLNRLGAFSIGAYATYSRRSDDIGVTLTPSSTQQAFRGYVDGEGRFQLDPDWTVSGSLRVASDRTFLRRYDISRDDRLRNNLRLERVDSDSYLTINAWAVQSLRIGDSQGAQPIALPEIDYRRRFDEGLLGGRVEAQLNTLALTRTAGQDTQRAFASLRWDLREITTGGQELIFTAYGRGDIYNAHDVLQTAVASYRGEPGFHARGIGALAMEVRWPLVGPAFGGTQRITPRFQIVAAPKLANMEVPNEDSRAVDLEDSNLFALNRFPGYDRFEDSTRFTWGLDYSLYLKGFSIDSNVGQSYRISSRPTLFPDGTGLTDRVSDIVGRTEIRYKDFVSLTHRYRLDKDNLAVRRNEVDATIGSRSTYVLLGYLRLNRNITTALEDLQDREEARVGARVQIARFWSIFGSTLIDLTNRDEDPLSLADGFQPVRHRLGFAYEDDCLRIGLTWKRDYQDTGDAKAGNSFLLTLAFKNLGR